MKEVNQTTDDEGTSQEETTHEETNIATRPLRLQQATEEQQAVQPAGKTSNCRLHSEATNTKIYSQNKERKTLLSNVYYYVLFICTMN